jgi:hypothetical protein
MTTEPLNHQPTADARAHAERIVEGLRARINDSKVRYRIWEGPGYVRIYTGIRSEYVQVEADGTATMSRDRMAWAHVIGEVIA